MPTRFRVACATLLIASALVLPARPASAAPQQAPARVESANVSLSLNRNASETRKDFYEVLSQHPPSLGRVLRLDPTLLSNAQYLASYPKVAAFVAQNPDIPRNPAYYLERYDSYVFQDPEANRPYDPRRDALRLWEDTLTFFGALLVMSAFLVAFVGAVRYIVEYRRWNRVSKVNAEVHNKILDRFGSNEELLAYIDSPPGRRFLEATPIATSGAPSRTSAPFGRILLSVQLGILLVALAFGLWFVSNRAIDEVRQLLVGISVLAFFLGVGSVVSAGASFVLSRKLGLLSDGASRPQIP